jgi:alpha-L-rhamnosidase
MSANSNHQYCPKELKVDLLDTPIGIGTPSPEFSWVTLAVAAAELPVLHQVQIALMPNFDPVIWDSGIVPGVAGFNSLGIASELVPFQQFFWRVRQVNASDAPELWSEIARFETAPVRAADWHASWIVKPEGTDDQDHDRVVYFRGKLDLSRPVARARAYCSALGWYRLIVNGSDLTGTTLVPRWTPYDHVVEFQAYDVTQMLRRGENAIGVVVGDGRFRGCLGAFDKRARYGDQLAALVQLEIEFDDGTRARLCTDEAWQAGFGGIVRSDPKHGEHADLRISDLDWWNFDDQLSGFEAVEILAGPQRTLIGEASERVAEIGRRQPELISRSPKGKILIDFGQNFAGWIRIRLNGAANSEVALTYSELLTPDGELDVTYLLPTGKPHIQRDRIILSGEVQSFEPKFSIHGFRYVEVDGLDDPTQIEMVEAVIMSTAIPFRNKFVCSDVRLNQLWENIGWSFRSNFMDTPTDCPTRERSGWTGDIQVFARTALLMADVQGFLRRYLQNLALEQFLDGRIPPFIPSECSTFSGGPSRFVRMTASSVGWGDAAVMVPWLLYQYCGDRAVLDLQYSSMKRWVGYLAREAGSKRGRARWFSRRLGDHDRYIIGSAFHWGEWLRPGDGVKHMFIGALIPEAIVATAYFANSVQILANVAEVLRCSDDAAHYGDLAEKVRQAWRTAFVRPTGRIGRDRQDDYVRALAFDLLEPHQRQSACDRLVALIEKNGGHLSTGFLSTGLLLGVLSRFGRADVAYRLLMQTTMPSWLSQIEKGATSIWETWEGYRKDGKGLWSHNHYALGAVAQWMIEGIAGVYPISPGYRSFAVKPMIGGGLSHCEATVHCPFGPIMVEWRMNADVGNLELVVPMGTTASIELLGEEPIIVGTGKHSFSWRT